jgi:hypothetical protein
MNQKEMLSIINEYLDHTGWYVDYDPNDWFNNKLTGWKGKLQLSNTISINKLADKITKLPAMKKQVIDYMAHMLAEEFLSAYKDVVVWKQEKIVMTDHEIHNGWKQLIASIDSKKLNKKQKQLLDKLTRAQKSK